jgi:hypothetical protein
MGTFVRRLVALTAVWLLATAALTYAAARRVATPPIRATTTTATAPAPAKTLIVPDVRRQAYVFAEGTLGDAGFGWRVTGRTRGFAANTVVAQTPAPGTRVIDTGNPTIVLALTQGKGTKEVGIAENSSPTAGTALRLADLAAAAVAAAPKQAVRRVATTVKKQTKRVVKKVARKAPAHRRPQQRPPAFVVPGARREPLDEIPLTARAQMLVHWVNGHPTPSDANVRYWLYQHAWIVAGARLGWWHGNAALKTLVGVDNRVWDLWGIGARSEQLARNALAEVEARSS